MKRCRESICGRASPDAHTRHETRIDSVETCSSNRRTVISTVPMRSRSPSERAAGRVTASPVQERPVLAPEVLERRPVSGDDDPRVPARHAVDVDPRRRVPLAAEDVLAFEERDLAARPEQPEDGPPARARRAASGDGLRAERVPEAVDGPDVLRGLRAVAERLAEVPGESREAAPRHERLRPEGRPRSSSFESDPRAGRRRGARAGGEPSAPRGPAGPRRRTSRVSKSATQSPKDRRTALPSPRKPGTFPEPDLKTPQRLNPNFNSRLLTSPATLRRDVRASRKKEGHDESVNLSSIALGLTLVDRGPLGGDPRGRRRTLRAPRSSRTPATGGRG